MSMIGDIQQEVADQISAQPFFENIAVVTESVGDLMNAFEAAISAATSTGGKCGAFVFVMSPDANVTNPEPAGPLFDEIDIHIQVTVQTDVANDPEIGVGVSDLDICIAICQALNKFYPPSATAPLREANPTIQLMDRSDGRSTRLVRYKAQGCTSQTIPKLSTPGISENGGGVITLTGATPGEAIFYTLDGRNPMPRNGTLYTAPFTPAPGLTLKARAFLAGYLNSDFANTTT